MSRTKEINSGRPFYRYIPKRGIIVNGVFITVLTLASVLLLNMGVWPLSIVFGIVVLNTIKDLVQESVIELWSDGGNIIYTRKSILGKKTIEIPIIAVAGINSQITSMWRGNISEKLVLETTGKEYLLHPHYSRNDPVTKEIHHHLDLLREQAAREEQTRREAACHAHRKKKVKKSVWGMLEMSIQCPRCQAHIPVNGPFTELVCSECFEEIELSPHCWTDLLEDVRDETAYRLEKGEGSKSSILGVFNTSLFYGRLRPYCPECKNDFDMDKDSRTEENRVICSSCGNSVSLSPPPEWFKKVYRGAEQIVGASKTCDAKKMVSEPVVLTCSSCGAPFETKGATRSVSCPHCDSSFFLPDDLWFHFHPAPTRKRWFVGFKAAYSTCEE